MGALTLAEKIHKARHNIEVWTNKLNNWNTNFAKFKAKDADLSPEDPTIEMKIADYNKKLSKEMKRLAKLEAELSKTTKTTM